MMASLFNLRHRPAVVIGILMLLALGLHLFIIGVLNVVEDESAYMMDAWQISFSVLPFREFGATKGPVFLVLLKIWQLITGQTLTASRLFPSLLHVVSIPLLFVLARRLTASPAVAYVAGSLWAVVPAAVGLTTNVVHIPLELVFIFLSFGLLTQPTKYKLGVPLAALLFFLALLTRATAIAFVPAAVFLLIWFSPDKLRIRNLAVFALTGVFLLALTMALIYPLYGWPKTAFFFNLDATLIAHDQQAAYAEQQPFLSDKLLEGLAPMLYEGWPVLILAILWPWLAVGAQTRYLKLVLIFVLMVGARWLFDPVFDLLRHYWNEPAVKNQVVFARTQYVVLLFAGALAILFQKSAGQDARPTQRRQLIVTGFLIVWVASFMLFYHFWGRTPTPYYVLETIPALSMAAALSLVYIFSIWRGARIDAGYLLRGLLAVTIFAGLWLPYTAVSIRQYRGTIAPDAAKTVGEHIREKVPKDEPVFTGQPVFAFLGQRPLYGYYTHPGWYLYERIGFLPTEIRRIFFPDFDDLANRVANEVNWIVVDWRTWDVFFNENSQETKLWRDLLAERFEPVVTVENDITRPITLYRRK